MWDVWAWAALVVSGVLTGIVVAAPIGPVNLICIRRTLRYGPINGFFSGLGAAGGDALFAAIVAFGVTAIFQLIQTHSTVLQVVGGVFLIGFGVVTYLQKPKPLRSEDDGITPMVRSTNLRATVASTFFLTVTNPATLAGFALIFTGLGSTVQGEANFLKALVWVAAVFGGSAVWWFGLTAFVGLLHGKITDATMIVINHVSGVVIGLFGLAVLGHLAFERL